MKLKQRTDPFHMHIKIVDVFEQIQFVCIFFNYRLKKSILGKNLCLCVEKQKVHKHVSKLTHKEIKKLCFRYNNLIKHFQNYIFKEYHFLTFETNILAYIIYIYIYTLESPRYALFNE